MICEEPAEKGPYHCGDAEDRAERPLVSASVPQWDDLPDDGHRRHHDRATTDALQCPRCDERGHRSGEPAQDRPAEKKQNRRLEYRLAAKQVAELTDDRGDDR